MRVIIVNFLHLENMNPAIMEQHIIRVIFNVAALGASIDDAVNDKIENYRKGNVSRIVNYKVKTIDGKTTVTDSTYYYRDKKRN